MGIFFILCSIDEHYEVIYLCLSYKSLYHFYINDGFIYSQTHIQIVCICHVDRADCVFCFLSRKQNKECQQKTNKRKLLTFVVRQSRYFVFNDHSFFSGIPTCLFCLLLCKNQRLEHSKRQLPYYHKSVRWTSDSTMRILYPY